MIPNDLVSAILGRMSDLAFELDSYQLKTQDEVNNYGGEGSSALFAPGMYKCEGTYHLGRTIDKLSDPIIKVKDGNGSSFMGLWYLATTYKILHDARRESEVGTGQELTPTQKDKIDELCRSILSQHQTAADLPKFFQGTTQDVLNCPDGSMGWWPLVNHRRTPAMIPEKIRDLMGTGELDNLANNSDGDIWSWCMTIDDAMGEDFQFNYKHGASINTPHNYIPCLGTSYTFDDLDGPSKALIDKVLGPDQHDKLPIGTFLGSVTPPAFPPQHPQRISCVVGMNMLAAIPLVEADLTDHLDGIHQAVEYIQEASRQLFDGSLTPHEYAYDYSIIEGTEISYLARAHKRIHEIDRVGYPKLLTPNLEEDLVSRISFLAEQILDLDLSDDEWSSKDYAAKYASLTMYFNGMMNLRFVNPTRFEQELVDRCAQKLLLDNPYLVEVAGTGPYPVLNLKATQIWVKMRSVCFVAPPLMEAYALYLLLEGRKRD